MTSSKEVFCFKSNICQSKIAAYLNLNAEDY